MLRLAAVVAVAACAPDTRAPVVVPGSARSSTLEVAFVDQVDGAAATHLAVGGRMRIRVADAVLGMLADGPFAIARSGDDLLAITATGAGAGSIEIETATGFARLAVTAAPIDSITMACDPSTGRDATIVLRDGRGKRLVDANLRIAPGSAPVTFVNDVWDRVVFEALPPGDVLVKTDLLGATPAIADASCTPRDSLAAVVR